MFNNWIDNGFYNVCSFVYIVLNMCIRVCAYVGGCDCVGKVREREKESERGSLIELMSRFVTETKLR